MTEYDLSEYDDPEQYDRDNRWAADDDFYLALAKEIGGPVLDVACGTGRLTRAIAEAGIAVTGLDLSRPMLDHARQKTPDLGITWLLADCRRMQLAQRFNLIIMTSHGFQHLLSDDDINAFLRQAHLHLQPGGRLAFETRILATRSYVTEPEPQFSHTETLADGSQIDHWSWSIYDAETQVDSIYFEEKNRKTGAVKRDETHLRYIEQADLNQMLTENGFQIDAQFGYWDRRPVTADAKELITLSQALIST